jgi:hypothetical protein
MKRIQLGLAALLCAAGAQADTLYTLAAPTGPLSSPGSVLATFSAGAGAGNVSFELQGYTTLDGDNFFIDIFHLTVNGAEIFSGTWDLGGGGANRTLLDLNGATVTISAPTKTVDISVPVTLVSGSNTVTFAYDSPTSFEGTSRAGPQGLGDEGWGLNSAVITGNAAVGAVPEVETYTLMLAGLTLMGFMARRRKS